MIKQNIPTLRKVIMGVDLCFVAGCFILGWHISSTRSIVDPLLTYLGYLPFLILIWGIMLNFVNLYDSFRVKNILDVVLGLLEAAFFLMAFLGSYFYIFKIKEINPGVILFTVCLTAGVLIFEKVCLLFFFRYVRAKGYNYKVVVIVGAGKRVRQFVNLINKHKEWGFKILGIVDKDEERVGDAVGELKIIGSFKDVSDIIHNNVVDQVVFVVPHSWLGEIEPVMKACEIEGIQTSIAMDYFELKLSKAKQVDLPGFPLLTFESTSDKTFQLIIKNVSDIIFSAVFLILLVPFFCLIALVIKLTSPGPVLFSQERCGVNGRRFMLTKFRTMVVDAESQLKHLQKHNEMGGPAFKMKDDPRVTTAGRFLRRLSLDELPQLWNVFCGDMSVVGPRPPLPSEVEGYDNWQRRRLSMKPGLTCLWQVNGRNKIKDFNEWKKLDLEYIDNWSLGRDIKIFLKTVPVVLFGIGAK